MVHDCFTAGGMFRISPPVHDRQKNDMIQPIFFHDGVSQDRQDEDLFLGFQHHRLSPKFHYVSGRQARRWLEVHQAFSPSRTDAGCRAIYENAFAAAARLAGSARAVQVTGVGCGGGMKDSMLVGTMLNTGVPIRYIPADISPSLVYTAAKRIRGMDADIKLRPLVMDLAHVESLESFWRQDAPEGELQVFSALGMLPNLPPPFLLETLAHWAAPGDLLVLSANLAPDEDYQKGCEAILGQYDNEQTRRWLMTFWDDFDVPRESLDLTFEVRDRFMREPSNAAGPASDHATLLNSTIKAVVANVHVRTRVEIPIANRPVILEPGASIEVFYSNRFIPTQLSALLQRFRFEICDSWIMPSKEEGVWLLRKMENLPEE
jgi:L-histidine N-alpha-methyltransferase